MFCPLIIFCKNKNIDLGGGGEGGRGGGVETKL